MVYAIISVVVVLAALAYASYEAISFDVDAQ